MMSKIIINKFQGYYRFLSNFWGCIVLYEGILYPSVEHAYQAAKSTDRPIRKQFVDDIMSPGQAKRKGNFIKLREDWEQKKVSIMEELVKDKFTRNEDLKIKLLNTGTAELQEGNYWGDTFWGIDLTTGKGENHLGKILMKVRENLSEKK